MTDPITDWIHRFSKDVFRLIHRIVDDREEAFDLSQELFVKLLRHRPSATDDAGVRAYLLKAAYRTALNAKRNRSRRRSLADEAATFIGPTAPRDAHGSLEQAELRTQVHRALEGLADRQREALTLRYYGDMRIPEIAAAMGISEGSVKMHMARGLRNLRAEMLLHPHEEGKGNEL